MESKPFWKSKTLWVNVVTLLTALLPPVRDFAAQMGWSTEAVVSLIAAANVVLRVLTGQPVKVR